MFNVSLEAWSKKGISTISSRLGRPIMMDKMTADMCNKGKNSKKKSKWVKVKYSWKPMVCNHCKVFGHSFFKCTLRPRTEKEKEKSDNAGNMGKSKEGFTEVRNGKNFSGFGGNFNRRQGGSQGFRNRVKTMFVPKIPTAPVMDKAANTKQSENAWEAMEIGDNDSDEEDVEMIYDEFVQAVIADVIDGRGSGIGHDQ
nr:hypothetical protein [Tanacetum cinerariifolium]